MKKIKSQKIIDHRETSKSDRFPLIAMAVLALLLIIIAVSLVAF